MITTADIDLIRDEIGSQPDDDTLEGWFDELEHWMPVAIRVLKRRFADASAGGQEVSNFTLDGVLGVGFTKASLSDLSRQIARLEAAWAALNDAPVANTMQVAPLVRWDRYR